MFTRNTFPIFYGTAEFKSTVAFLGGLLLLLVGWWVLPLSLGHAHVYTKLGVFVAIVAICATAKKLSAGPYNTVTANLKGKTAVVTGGATGIGIETVRELARMGATVIIAARGGAARLDAAVAEARKGLPADKAKEISGMSLDLSSFASIHTFVQEFLAEHTRLHLLVNNAGVMMCPHTLTEDGLEMQMGTNYFGHFLLTNLLLDTLIASKARVVNVASVAHSFVLKLVYPKMNDKKKYDPLLAYGDSKLANIYFTTEFERRYGSKGVHSYAVHPGGVMTPLSRHIPTVLRHILSFPQWLTFKQPFEGCQTTLFACVSNEAVPGAYHADCAKWVTTPAAQDKEKAKWLWEEAEKITKIGGN